MDNIEKVIDKIRKLLALSTSPNENEAALAANKAQALLAEYNLSMTDVGQKKDDGITQDNELVNESHIWMRYIGSAVAQLYFCKYFYVVHKEATPSRKYGWTRYDVHHFVGAPHNITVCKLMFSYICGAIDKLAEAGAREVPSNKRYQYLATFKTAAMYRVCKRIEDRINAAAKGEIKNPETGKNLPALLDLYKSTQERIDEYLSEEKTQIKSYNRGGLKKRDSQGWSDGHKAGDSIGLDQQIKGESKYALPSS